MSRLRQNNPILYLFIDVADPQAADAVRTIQRKRVDVSGIGYLSVSAENSPEEILAGIQKAQSDFLRTVYVTTSEIKLVYVIDADTGNAAEILRIKNDVESTLHLLYPGGVLSDIFLLLDDRVNLISSGNRAEIIDSLGALPADSNMIYILSNVNSRKLYEADSYDRILHCIALMCIMKDYVSLQSDQQVYRWYNERYFKEDCFRNGGKFMTVGYLSIKKPVELLKKVFLIELLRNRQVLKPAETDFCWETREISETGWNYVKNNLQGLGINMSVDRQSLGKYTNKQALDRIFDNRLEQFFKMNFKEQQGNDGQAQVKDYLQACCRDPKKGFYYVHNITAPEGSLRKYLDNCLTAVENELKELNAESVNWQNEMYVPREKKGLSFSRVPDDVYEMAAKYLEPWFRRLRPEFERQALREALKYVDELHEEFERNRLELEAYIDVLEAQAEDIRTTNKYLFFKNENINSYYLEFLRDFIKTDSRYDNLYSRLWRGFGKTGLNMYALELESYIEQVILPLDVFSKSVCSDLRGLNIYDNIWEWITNNRYFNILLKSSGASLHSEINVFIDVNSQLAVTAKAGSNFQKMNFFYEDYHESIDVLYHGGAFSKEDLYYEALYEKR